VRVIGGLYKGRRLKAPEGEKVRPTSDRLRETLFNILSPRIVQASFLDICAGSGAVGIEALSRGASRASFIELSRRACLIIEANLKSLEAETKATVINRDAASALKRLSDEAKQFDIVFFDPPYASEIYSQVMSELERGAILNQQSIVVVEHRAKTPPQSQYGRLKIYRIVKQGESALAFYDVVDG